jgi:hypothetical protein
MKIDLKRTDFVELPILLVKGSVILSNSSFNLLFLCPLVYRRRQYCPLSILGLEQLDSFEILV